MKFVLFVEGYTEKAALGQFIKRWLDPRLPQPVGVNTVRFDGWRHYADEIATKVDLNLTGKGHVIAGIGLLDLYGPNFYPGHLTTADEKYSWAKQHFEQMVGNAKFRQHFAVHETEAWLLSDPAIFPMDVQSALPNRPPETVNFHKPPKKLLQEIYWSRLHKNYKPVIDGSDLFQDLSPDAAYQRCPRFKLLLDDMLQLAKAR